MVFEYLGKRDTFIRRYQALNDMMLMKPDNNKFDTLQINDLEELMIYNNYKLINGGTND